MACPALPLPPVHPPSSDAFFFSCNKLTPNFFFSPTTKYAFGSPATFISSFLRVCSTDRQEGKPLTTWTVMPHGQFRQRPLELIFDLESRTPRGLEKLMASLAKFPASRSLGRESPDPRSHRRRSVSRRHTSPDTMQEPSFSFRF